MIIFIIGGSGSGKSEYAENLVLELKREADACCKKPKGRTEFGREEENLPKSRAQRKARLVYVATMEPMDEESRQRISRHRSMRAGRQFETRECYTHLELLETNKDDILLLECLSNLMANEMFSPAGRKERAAELIQEGICRLAKNCRHLVIVGNNVYEDGVEYDSKTREYMRQMAKIHRFLGQKADRAVEVICAIPVEWRRV